MKNFVQPGKTLTLTAPSGGVVGGNLYKIGSIFGVAVQSAAEGTAFDLETGGVYDLAKVSAQAWNVGDAIYADSSNILTTVASGNTKVGVAVAAAANPSGTGRARLNASF